MTRELAGRILATRTSPKVCCMEGAVGEAGDAAAADDFEREGVLAGVEKFG